MGLTTSTLQKEVARSCTNQSSVAFETCGNQLYDRLVKSSQKFNINVGYVRQGL